MNDILDPQLMHPRDQIAMVISRIYRRGMTTTSGGYPNFKLINQPKQYKLLLLILLRLLNANIIKTPFIVQRITSNQRFFKYAF